MRAVILYHPESEFSRSIEEYTHDFDRTRSVKIELISLETADGSDMARTYDIVQYPSLLVLRDTGELMKVWQGMPLPLMNEVAGYLEA